MENKVDFQQNQVPIRLQLTMYFAYNGQQRTDYAAFATTYEAVKAGKRTSTLRKREWYKKSPWHYQALLKLKQGDCLALWSGKTIGQGDHLIVRLLSDAIVLPSNLTDSMLEDLSQCEGWTVDYLRTNGYQHSPGCVQLRYNVV